MDNKSLFKLYMEVLKRQEDKKRWLTITYQLTERKYH